MRRILCLSVLIFLASCDNSKQQLASTQAALSDTTKERDELKAKVASLQQELDSTKAELAKPKSDKPPSGTMAAQPSDAKTGANNTNAKAASKGKHRHKS